MSGLSTISDEIAERRLADQAEQARWFAALRKHDPEVADRAMRVYKTVDRAAAWATRERTQYEVSPIEMVARGERGVVLAILGRIEHGVAV